MIKKLSDMQFFDLKENNYFTWIFLWNLSILYVCTASYFWTRVTQKGTHYLIAVCDLNTLLIETHLSFIFQWHLLQPERWVVCVGELKIASDHHTAILSLPSFSLKRKRNSYSVLGTLKISITKNVNIINHCLDKVVRLGLRTFYFIRISKILFKAQLREAIELVNVNIQKMMFANDIDISVVYLALFYHIMPHYAATRLLWIISFHIIITA